MFMRMKNLLVIMAIAATLGMTTLADSAAGVAAQTETFRALVQGTTTVGPATAGGQTTVLISISRWSTDAERDELLRILAEEGDEPMADALQKQEETGFIRFPGNQKSLADQIADGTATFEGDASVLEQLASTLVVFEVGFEILPGTAGTAVDQGLNPFEVGDVTSRNP